MFEFLSVMRSAPGLLAQGGYCLPHWSLTYVRTFWIPGLPRRVLDLLHQPPSVLYLSWAHSVLLDNPARAFPLAASAWFRRAACLVLMQTGGILMKEKQASHQQQFWSLSDPCG